MVGRSAPSGMRLAVGPLPHGCSPRLHFVSRVCLQPLTSFAARRSRRSRWVLACSATPPGPRLRVSSHALRVGGQFASLIVASLLGWPPPRRPPALAVGAGRKPPAPLKQPPISLTIIFGCPTGKNMQQQQQKHDTTPCPRFRNYPHRVKGGSLSLTVASPLAYAKRWNRFSQARP